MQMNNVGKKMKLESCFDVSSKGKSGGLAMLWSQDIKVDIASFSDHHIDAEVEVENGKHMRCTGVYRHPEASQKKHTWTLLRRLVGLSSSPWLFFGDFNEILHLNEKNRGNDRDANWINDFREVIRECKLRDLGCIGHPFYVV